MSNPPGDGDPSALDPRLDELPFTRRLREMAAAKGATTLRQLARLPPSSLVADRTVASTTVADGRVILERFLGRTWEELASLVPLRAVPRDAPPRLPTGWDELRLVLPPPLRAWLLADIADLPFRVQNLAERRALLTLGELGRLSEAQLRDAGGIGRVAVRHLFLAVSAAAARAGARVVLPPPDGLRPAETEPPRPAEIPFRPRPAKQGAVLGLLETWQLHVQALSADQRRAMALHAGLDGSPRLTSAAVGEEMGISGAKAYRLDAQARGILLQHRAWIDQARARFAAVLRQPRVRLARLAGDPWWAEIVLLPQALDYFAESVLEEASVLDVGGQLYLAKWGPEDE